MSTTTRSSSTQTTTTTAAKTSIQILQERNELSALLKKIEREAEHAMTHPEISFLALCRVVSLIRSAADEPSPSSSEKISAPPSVSRSTSTSTSASPSREAPPSPLQGYGVGLVAEQQLLLPLLPLQRSNLRVS
jgi:hypothetical protein